MKRYAKKVSLTLLICVTAVAAVDAQVRVEELSEPGATGGAATQPAASTTVKPAGVAEGAAAPAGATGQPAAAPASTEATAATAPAATTTSAPPPADTAEAPAATTEELPGEYTVRLSVKDADLSAILKLLAEQHKLNIIAGKDVTGRVTADFYGITVDQALKAVLEMNGYTYVREGDFIKVYTYEQLQVLQRAQARIVTRVFKLNYINVDEAKELLRPILSKTAQISTTSRAAEGIPSGGTSVGGDSYSLSDKLVVRDFEENIKQAEDVLKEIDVRPLQVMVEATILAVTLNDDASVGIDFNALSGIDFGDLSAATLSATNPQSALTGGATVPLASIPFGRAGTQGFAQPGNGLNIGIITNDVSVFIRALETVEDVNVLSNPKIMALNKQRAEVLVGDRLGYRTTTLTQTTAVETVEFLETGTQLRFRPFISNDGFIRMEIHPEVSTGTISALGLPSQQTTEVTCNIIVRDGHTVVIGGLFDETTRVDKNQVPLLGSIPLLGVLFRSDHHATRRREIIILLTPHILDHDIANAEGLEMLDRIERQVTGLRSSFPFYTREKLTQIHLMEADKYCLRYQQTGEDCDRAMAIWNLKLARNVAPNNIEVIRRLDAMEADAALSRPRLQNESALWRRMHGSGMLDQPPVLPLETPVNPAARPAAAEVEAAKAPAPATAAPVAPASNPAAAKPAKPVTSPAAATATEIEPVTVPTTVEVIEIENVSARPSPSGNVAVMPLADARSAATVEATSGLAASTSTVVRLAAAALPGETSRVAPHAARAEVSMDHGRRVETLAGSRPGAGGLLLFMPVGMLA